jgi:hypothetical protein
MCRSLQKLHFKYQFSFPPGRLLLLTVLLSYYKEQLWNSFCRNVLVFKVIKNNNENIYNIDRSTTFVKQVLLLDGQDRQYLAISVISHARFVR